MTTTAWRVVHKRYVGPPGNPFDGEGSRLSGGRWNSPGVAVVYLAGFRSLAVLETLVHATGRSSLMDRVIYPATFPLGVVTPVDQAALPDDWQNPQAPLALRLIGDGWARQQRSAVLEVPSAVVLGEPNYMLNPGHPDFGLVVIGPQQPLPVDPRLITHVG